MGGAAAATTQVCAGYNKSGRESLSESDCRANCTADPDCNSYVYTPGIGSNNETCYILKSFCLEKTENAPPGSIYSWKQCMFHLFNHATNQLYEFCKHFIHPSISFLQTLNPLRQPLLVLINQIHQIQQVLWKLKRWLRLVIKILHATVCTTKTKTRVGTSASVVQNAMSPKSVAK